MKPKRRKTNISSEERNPEPDLHLFHLCVVIMVIFLISSCDDHAVYDKNISLPEFSWNFQDTLSFHVNIADTSHAHNIYLNIRNSESYQYSNIFLFVSTYAPTGHFLKDTFEIKLADKSGKWFGRGVGNVFSLQVPYKRKIKFPYKGIYLFEIQHAMWNKNLKGIADVGLRVEKDR
jgi:gliding motility-associated lipoprotein GldH